MNKQNLVYAKGKQVFFINGVSFENSKNARDGLTKATNYALENSLNPNDIIKFDSRVERDRYVYLSKMQEEGKISNLTYHFVLRVQNEFTNCNGDLIPAINYESDFCYLDNGVRVVEDTKGSAYFIDEYFLTLKKVFDKVFKEKNIYLRVILPNNGSWKEWKFGETKKSQKLIKKQRDKINEFKKASHLREIEQKKIDRLKVRYNQLIAKNKLNKRERERLEEIKKYLKEKGVLL